MQPAAEDPSRLCDFLEVHQEDILAQWERALRRLEPEAQLLAAPALRNHIPDLLRSIADVVRMVHQGKAASLGELPDLHALDRLATGFDLRAAAAELALLRDVTLELWRPLTAGRDPAVLVEEIRWFNRAVDGTTFIVRLPREPPPQQP